MLKNWCFWTVKTLESSLDCKEIEPVNPKADQPWIFIGRTDAEAEASILWPPDLRSQLIGKDPDAGKDQRQEEKGTTENDMVGWLHQLNGREFKQSREMVKNRESWHAAVCGVTKRWTQLSNWRILHFSNCEQLSVPWFATVSDALRPLPMLFFCALNSLPQLPEAYATYCQSLEINSLQRPSLTPSHSLSGLPSTQSYNNICHIVVQMLSSFICIFHQSRSILKPRNALFTSSPPLSNTMHGTY